MHPIAVSTVAVALCAGSALSGVLTFAAGNHPDGSIAPQAYGLRLDRFGGEDPATFTFEVGGQSSVTVTIDFDLSGAADLTISGRVQGNSAAPTNGQPNPVDFGVFDLDVTYTGTWDGSVFVSSETGTVGTLSQVGGTGNADLASRFGAEFFSGADFVLDIMGKQRNDGALDGVSFVFGDVAGSSFAAESRLGGFDAFEGFYEGIGWVKEDPNFGNDTMDFLFTASPEIIPTPGSAAMLLIAGGVSVRRRRRQA